MDGGSVMKLCGKTAFYMTASILLSSIAQLCMKAGMLLAATHAAAGSSAVAVMLQQPTALLWVGAGLTGYGISMLFWMSAIARLELSLAYPMLSLSYVLVYVLAVHWPLLNEEASWTRTAGILVVIAGVILSTRSGSHTIASGSEPPGK
jgi:undecaprenyl phosphate-alpha-L-ara4N flippase subunit ArnF